MQGQDKRSSSLGQNSAKVRKGIPIRLSRSADFLNHSQGQAGFTLVEIMVVMGLMGVTSMGVLSLNEYMNKSVNTTKKVLETQGIVNALSLVVSDAARCGPAVYPAGPPGQQFNPDPGAIFPNLSLVYNGANYTAGYSVGTPPVRIQSLQYIRSANACIVSGVAPNQSRDCEGTLRLTVSKEAAGTPAANRTTVGQETSVHDFVLRITVQGAAGAGAITSCQGGASNAGSALTNQQIDQVCTSLNGVVNTNVAGPRCIFRQLIASNAAAPVNQAALAQSAQVDGGLTVTGGLTLNAAAPTDVVASVNNGIFNLQGANTNLRTTGAIQSILLSGSSVDLSALGPPATTSMNFLSQGTMGLAAQGQLNLGGASLNLNNLPNPGPVNISRAGQPTRVFGSMQVDQAFQAYQTVTIGTAPNTVTLNPTTGRIEISGTAVNRGVFLTTPVDEYITVPFNAFVGNNGLVGQSLDYNVANARVHAVPIGAGQTEISAAVLLPDTAQVTSVSCAAGPSGLSNPQVDNADFGVRLQRRNASSGVVNDISRARFIGSLGGPFGAVIVVTSPPFVMAPGADVIDNNNYMYYLVAQGTAAGVGNSIILNSCRITYRVSRR